MYLPPLHPVNNSHFYMSGNVTIHPSAAIAPGVLLQADPESGIIIAAGACIGMGAVLHAHQGILEVEEGTNIGAGVLIVGKGKIGTNACIGAMTTIWNSSIGRGEIVPPGSLVGDTGRQVDQAQRIEATTTPASESSSNQQVAANQLSQATTKSAAPKLPLNHQASDALEGSTTQVYGQANLNQLLAKLLPHRQALNSTPQDDQSPSNGS